ncbi:cytochrome c3 family protein [Geomonas diazotrophica]|nr:cytochrome c3 family protein [Geomonas nitrogeniifigens]
MKTSWFSAIFPVMCALATMILVQPRALAFHSGGAGECEGCHSMHGSKDGVVQIGGGASLLKGSDASSTCLLCHQANGDSGPTTYHVSTPDGEIPPGTSPKQLSPGGDFGWLKKSFTWYADMTSPMSQSSGERHGHNIVAQDFNYQPDITNITAPGGSYPSQALSCISCHDPHGRYRRTLDGSVSTSGAPIKASGSFLTSPEPDAAASVGTYRLLAGSGYYTKALGAGQSFIYGPPAALAPLVANRSEDTTQTRIAYGAGISDWCRNCHTDKIHNGTVSFQHPTSGVATGTSSGVLGPDMVNYYDSYVKTGDLTGTAGTAYLSLVPFEIGTNNYATLRTILSVTPTKGPDTADGTPAVMCLSCHRAHASGWDEAVRWNSKSTQIEYAGKYSQEGQLYQPYGQGRSEAEARQAYYQIPATFFASNQQPLCYKCHATLPQ